VAQESGKHANLKNPKMVTLPGLAVLHANLKNPKMVTLPGLAVLSAYVAEQEFSWLSFYGWDGHRQCVWHEAELRIHLQFVRLRGQGGQSSADAAQLAKSSLMHG
jgi:hypothetical protein